MGAVTQLWAATAADAAHINGKYLWPWAREGKTPGPAKNLKLQQQVWAWCEEQVKDV